jgi:phenylalanyl-tRNA synthetase alpha chain
MTEDLEQIRASILQYELNTEAQIEAFRIEFLGRKNGTVTGLFGRIKDIPPSERGAYGKNVNALKQLAESRIAEARDLLTRPEQDGSQYDTTLPGRMGYTGSLHPITSALEEVKRFFTHFGFSIVEGPDIEDDFHNFTALNFPPDHPARDMQDTLFVEPPPPEGAGVLLRTHTSPVQIRTMESSDPPYRVVVPGRVYRNEAISYKSFCLFHQVEGLCVDENVTMGDLKEILHVFARYMFGDDVRMRLRPSFFPFTEPSAEMDIWWTSGKGGEGQWLEILGCGMVDPNVLEAVDVDSERYTGYAFGMGIERIAMLRHGISDIRLLYENDIRFLSQF